MLLRLYCNNRIIPDQDLTHKYPNILQRCNVGFDKVMYKMWVLNGQGINTEVIETSSLAEEELAEAYLEVVRLAVSKKYRIRRVFGTKHTSMSRFGKEVPALLVYEDTIKELSDVYPRIERKEKVKTIMYFIQDLAAYIRYFGLNRPIYE